jgi:hypothetical protein
MTNQDKALYKARAQHTAKVSAEIVVPTECFKSPKAQRDERFLKSVLAGFYKRGRISDKQMEIVYQIENYWLSKSLWA